MHFILFLLLGLIAITLQSTFFSYFTIMGVKPDLLLIMVVFTAFIKGSKYGGIFGFMLGLIEDLITGRFIGMNALIKGSLGYLIGLTEGKIYKENLLAPGLLLLLASLLQGVLTVLLFNITGTNFALKEQMYKIIIPTAIYNAGLGPLFYLRFFNSLTKGILSGK